jgi:hypothetical protein
MTDTTTTPAAPLQGATLDLARSLLMAAGSPLLVKGIVTGDQWTAIAGGAVALISAAWSYVAAHPGKTPPLQAVQALVKTGGQAPQWDAALERLEPLLVKMAEKGAAAAIHAKAGILAGPLDAVADKAIQSAADQAAGHLKI